MDTKEIDKHRTWVAKEQNSAILYRDYQYMKMLLHIKGGVYDKYENQIELDIPRSYPGSIWLKHPASIALVRLQLKLWCVYSTIGYFQGMLFLLVPLCHRYQGLDHISFFAFATLVKRLHFEFVCQKRFRISHHKNFQQIFRRQRMCDNDSKIRDGWFELIN